MVTMKTKTLVASVVEEAVAEDSVAEGEALALQMTMKMKTLVVDLAAEVAVGEDLVTEEEEASVLQMTMTTMGKNPVDLAAEVAVVEDLVTEEEEASALQMTTMVKSQVDLAAEEGVVVVAALVAREEDLDLQMMMMKTLEDSIKEGVEVLEGAEEDLDPAVMTEKKTQVAVALAQDEEALVGLNHPAMVILKDLAAEEEVVLVALEETTTVTMMESHVDGDVVEVEGGAVEASGAVTTMMVTLTLQSLVVRFTRQAPQDLRDFHPVGSKPQRELYIPPELPDDEETVFSSLAAGINFSKYDDIPVEVTGRDPPTAINTFEEAGLYDTLMANVKKSHYEKPTPVQKHSLPIVLAGRDLMACAQTGSGKTVRCI